MKRFTLFFLVFAFLTLSGQVTEVEAAQGCYTPAQAEAEQAIRIHSELMVIGLNCQNMRTRGQNLYAQYRDFTFRHANLFAQYEEELMRFYRQEGVRNPEAKLNTLRTALANKVSFDAAKMSPDQFCNRYATRIPQAAHMSSSDVRRWASTNYQTHPVSMPLCRR